MIKQFCTYEIALALKELGFDEPCLALYKTDDKSFYLLHRFNTGIAIKIPLWQQAIDWCDTKGLLVDIFTINSIYYKSIINKLNYEGELFNSRNESIEKAINFAISYLQDNKYCKQ